MIQTSMGTLNDDLQRSKPVSTVLFSVKK